MDTTHIANTAEDLISHELQRSGLRVAKPKFDTNGADLLAFLNVDKGAKFCKIQCKGRSLTNSSNSNVKVLESYVTDGFIVFLFIDDGTGNTSNLFCFFSSDIKENWTLTTDKNSKNNYRLSFSKSNFQKKLSKNSFSDKKINGIKNVIKKSDPKKEFKKFTDLIIKQRDLIKLGRQKSELEKLIEEIENIDKLKTSTEKKLGHWKNISIMPKDTWKKITNS
ncbi:MAG: hypothetical protein WDZ80_02320 [Candidatus Paceibacterota bacterium]